MRTYSSYAMLYSLWKWKGIPRYFIEYFRTILSVKVDFSKGYDQYNYFYYDNYFSSMEPRILTPFTDRNIHVEPDFSGVCKILPRNKLGTLGNNG